MFIGNCFEIEYIKKFPFVKISKDNLFAIFFIAVLVGVGAWFMETLLDYVAMGYLFDRGFLIGPFIPVYFFCVFFGLLYIKTPKVSWKNFFIHILIIGGGISLVEFIVGNLCELVIGDVLWNYSDFMPLSYKYVSLTVGLIWGVLGTLLFMFVIPLIKHLPDKLNDKKKLLFTILFFIYFISDIIISIILIIKNGGKYEQLYEFKASIELSLFMIGIVLYILLSIFLGIYFYKHFLKLKKTSIIIYIISVLIPTFSCVDYFDRFDNKFLSFLASLGFIILAVYIYLLLSLPFIYLIKFILGKTTKIEFFKSKLVKSLCVYLAIAIGISTTIIGVMCVKIPKVESLTIGSGEKHLNIVAVSDIHYGSTGTNVDLEKMVEMINNQKPDVVFLLGDIIDNSIDNLDEDYFVSNIEKIESEYGVYAVTGNHEYEYDSYNEVFEFLKKPKNVDLLVDETAIINGEVLLVGRLDFIYLTRNSLEELIGSDKNFPTIVLDHQPYDSDEAKEQGVSLQLSGHTHNGQLFPAQLIVYLYQMIRYKCDKVNGLYQEGDYSIYVSSGYGTWGFPLRTTGRSEIVQIDFYYE